MARGNAKTASPAPASAALSCVKCGREVTEADAFCIYCGTKVAESLKAAQAKQASAVLNNASKPPAAPVAAAPASAPASTDSKVVSAQALKDAQNAKKAPSSGPVPSKAAPAAGEAPKPAPSSAPSGRASHSAASEASHASSRDFQPSPNPAPRKPSQRPSQQDEPSPADMAALEKLWVPDNFASECMDCKANFGFGKRRHHCRVCGLLFCRQCLSNKVQVPASFGYGNATQRCCRSCVTALQIKTISSPADVFAQRRNKRTSDAPNNYDLLGVDEDASPEEITRQYKNISAKIDPSSQSDLDQLDKLNEAYRNLQDPENRSRKESDSRGSMYDMGDFVAEARSDQTECQVCFRPFKLGRRQHHCRRCTRSVCTQCSEGQKPIPELGFPMPVRHCAACMENPPKFIMPVMDPLNKPPAGFEYLSKLDIHLSVKAYPRDDDSFEVKTYCEPNKEAMASARTTMTDNDRQVANDYCIKHKRTMADFQWLFMAYGQYTNPTALPNFPDKRTLREKRAEVLESFVYGCMIHPLLRDADCLKAFLALPSDQFSSFKRAGPKKSMYDNDKYNDLVVSIRLELEKSQLRDRVQELTDRQKAHEARMKEQKQRAASQKKREDAQEVRRQQALARFKALEARRETQTERMEREKDRYEQQANTTHILFFDTVKDESQRAEEEDTREKEKVEFLKSKDSFQADTSQWNHDMAEWSKHRANWSEAHNPPISKDIASEWIVKSYGIFYSSQGGDGVPKELSTLHDQVVKMNEKEPDFLEAEGNAVDDEWMKLAKEREYWTNDRANMKREDEMCADEDKRYAQEHEYVRLAGEARQAKVKAIEADLAALRMEITSRVKCQGQRHARHEGLDHEFENEWRVTQKERSDTTKSRLAEHDARILRCKKRNEIFADQLERQTKSERMLLFKRAALTEERKADCTLFEEHKEDCKTALEESRNTRELTPEYIARLQADAKNRDEEFQIVIDSNKRTSYEGGDKEVDERDEFMNEVRRRRAQFQSELDGERSQLEIEESLCSSLLKRMEEHISMLDEEIANAAKEEALIAEFSSLLESEMKLLADEEAKREEKKVMITDLMNESGNWVLDALHEHSKRKKKEADRLVKQAVRASDLQQLVQHFTHRVIEQEERIMRQKQRILNGEHKIEMLKLSENWFQYVTAATPEVIAKDKSILEACQAERVEDLKAAARLQKDDENDIKSVLTELSTSRSFAKMKEEKRTVWAKVEDVYSQQKAQEKDEDMMMTSQIRSLLQQLGEAFEMLTNRVIEEEESLQHASTQLEGEVESINAFMQRMESEENALCSTEKTSLAKESQVRRTELDLIEQRARALIESYKQMQTDHAKYPTDLDKVKSVRKQRERVVSRREAELDHARKLIKSRNYYDRRMCQEFARKFKLDVEMKELRDVFEWLKTILEGDIKKTEKWLEASRKERKQFDAIKLRGTEINWDSDTLTRIPALKDVQKKLARASSNNTSNSRTNSNDKSSTAIHSSEQWIVELIQLKKSISEIDASVVKNSKFASDSAAEEEKNVQELLQQIKSDKEYVLNSIRFIDQEEAKAVRNAGKSGMRRNDTELRKSAHSNGPDRNLAVTAPPSQQGPTISPKPTVTPKRSATAEISEATL